MSNKQNDEYLENIKELAEELETKKSKIKKDKCGLPIFPDYKEEGMYQRINREMVEDRHFSPNPFD